MKKLFALVIVFALWVTPVNAANIALTSHGLASTMDMPAYIVVLDLVAAVDGSGSFNFATDGDGTLAGLFTAKRPGTILSIKVILGEGVDVPSTLFDVQLFDGVSTLKEDLLCATGMNLAVTNSVRLYVRNLDGSMVFDQLSSPPILNITHAGDGKKATFIFTVAR